MWVVVEPKESGEEPKCFAKRHVIRRQGWQSFIHCDTNHDAQELASEIRGEGFTVNISEPLLRRHTGIPRDD